MQIITGATANDIKPASLMMWEAFNCAATNRGKDYFYNLMTNEPYFEPEQLRLVKIDGRIAATVVVAIRAVFTDAEILLLGGIGNVAVHPDFRGRDLSLVILQNAIEYMTQRGFHASILYSGHIGLYEKVRFERMQRHGHVTGRVPGEAEPLVKTKDWALAKRLYDGSFARLSGGLVRSEAFWASYITRRWLAVADIVYSSDRSAYATVVVDSEDGSVTVVDAGYKDNPDQLTNLFATEFAGMRISTTSTDLTNPLLAAMESAIGVPSVVPSQDMMARGIGGNPVPAHIFDMGVDHF